MSQLPTEPVREPWEGEFPEEMLRDALSTIQTMKLLALVDGCCAVVSLAEKFQSDWRK